MKNFIHEYNSMWPKYFDAESELLFKKFNNKISSIHHIGSTSVPQLQAKNVIDIICVTNNLTSHKIALEAEYTYKGEYNIPLRFFYNKKTPKIEYHLHIVQEKHPFIELNLAFRNYLRQHPVIAQEYGQLKQTISLTQEAFDKKPNQMFNHYTLAKNNFIKNIINNTSYNDLNITFLSHNQEYNKVQEIIETHKLRDKILSDGSQFKIFVLYKGINIIGFAKINIKSGNNFLENIILIANYQKFKPTFLSMIEEWRQFHL